MGENIPTLVPAGQLRYIWWKTAAGGRTLSNFWITDLRHFLDEKGGIAPPKGPARRMAEYFSAIVAMITEMDENLFEQSQVRCRRRPGRKPCPGIIEGYVHPEPDDILWWCPECGDKGSISNWQGTLWDRFDDPDEPGN